MGDWDFDGQAPRARTLRLTPDGLQTLDLPTRRGWLAASPEAQVDVALRIHDGRVQLRERAHGTGDGGAGADGVTLLGITSNPRRRP